MLDVTEKAQEQVARFLKEHKPRPVRLFLSQGCGGGSLTLGLDEIGPDDAVFTVAGVQYIVEKGLMGRAKSIAIDYSGHGFQITSSLSKKAVCPGCGTPGAWCRMNRT